ncbi:MAG: hypothetical protein AMJ56_10120 [Anaerolineae bacterium SG8_19]|nr:MAG: hypothetical protein AMJ56_10120 [Anaerolineae bacterium SG8_19]
MPKRWPTIPGNKSCICSVANGFQTGVSQPTVSHHLGILREAGLVSTRREGKQVFYTLNQDAVAVCCGMLMQNFAPEKLEADGDS